MFPSKRLRSLRSTLATASLAALAFAHPSAPAGPVWNVNIDTELTTGDILIGAAPENTANSFWNPVTIANPTAMPLAMSPPFLPPSGPTAGSGAARQKQIPSSTTSPCRQLVQSRMTKWHTMDTPYIPDAHQVAPSFRDEIGGIRALFLSFALLDKLWNEPTK